MNDLFYLQDQLQHFILSGNSEIIDAIIPTERVSADDRLAIYRDAYRLRLIESLSTSFPALHLYLGTEEFKKLCASYIDQNPSSYRSVRWFGDALSEFLKRYYDKSCAYLAELADFEWKMTLAFDAADDPVLTIDDMAVVPPEAWAGMRFILHSSVQRLNYCWNAISVWQGLVHDRDLPAWSDNSKATSWVLWRSSDYLVQFYSMTEEEAWALDAVIQGLSFGVLCEGLCRWVTAEEVGMKAASYLKGWIQKGILSQRVSSDSLD